ncbi:MAG TPA: CPBP family glutamic-type intramembrane protease [Verrucomicrobiae bacterium]|nr:CPBP family glutamic-type intramembrane protease [Verrucomicrobiae bacterium]
MSVSTARRMAILEPLAVFALIMAYIWELRYSHQLAWIPILGMMVVSHLARKERAAALGFRSSNFRECLREFAPALGLIALTLLGSGILLQTTRSLDPRQEAFALGAYLPWGVFQQYVLNGYFLNRFDRVLSQRAAPVAAAAVFAGAHLPNWFLMAVTLPMGYCAARLYRRQKNLYFLGIAHAIIGFLLFLVVPDSISHHLRVGPGWWK